MSTKEYNEALAYWLDYEDKKMVPININKDMLVNLMLAAQNRLPLTEVQDNIIVQLVERYTQDDPRYDGTDEGHPAYKRGYSDALSTHEAFRRVIVNHRNEVLEEAARQCDPGSGDLTQCAKRIRALKTEKETP